MFSGERTWRMRRWAPQGDAQIRRAVVLINEPSALAQLLQELCSPVDRAPDVGAPPHTSSCRRYRMSDHLDRLEPGSWVWNPLQPKAGKGWQGLPSSPSFLQRNGDERCCDIRGGTRKNRVNPPPIDQEKKGTEIHSESSSLKGPYCSVRSIASAWR